MRNAYFEILTLSIVILVVALTGCKSTQSAVSPTEADQEEHLKVLTQRSKAYDFSLESFDGTKMTLADFKGKVTWMTFWASWCTPCRNELKILRGLHEKLKDRGFEVAAVSIDGSEEKAKVKTIFKSLRLDYKGLYDPDTRLAKRYVPDLGIPFGLLIDKQGNIALLHRGFVPGDEVKLEEIVLQELAR